MFNIEKAIEAINKLEPNEIQYVMRTLLEEEKIDIPTLISVYALHLQEFKHSARRDMQKLAEAGLRLGEPSIKKLKTLKFEQKKGLHTALANTLLTAGFRETQYNKNLSEYVDMSIVDPKWYAYCWKLETVNTAATPDV